MRVMAPGIRKFMLTAHVTSSVGWLGAVVAVLVLAVAGLVTGNPLIARGVYPAMDLIARFALVPLALASLLTGIVQGLGTAWGLIRHYWVVLKLLITAVATAVLLMYVQTLGRLAELAVAPGAHLAVLRTPSVVLHAGIALVLLVVATALAVYKPRGTTRYGWRALKGVRTGPP